jgi:hypothetical protein
MAWQNLLPLPSFFYLQKISFVQPRPLIKLSRMRVFVIPIRVTTVWQLFISPLERSNAPGIFVTVLLFQTTLANFRQLF